MHGTGTKMGCSCKTWNLIGKCGDATHLIPMASGFTTHENYREQSGSSVPILLSRRKQGRGAPCCFHPTRKMLLVVLMLVLRTVCDP